MARTTRNLRRRRPAALVLAVAVAVGGAACSASGGDDAGEAATHAAAAKLDTAGGGASEATADEGSATPALPKGLGSDRVVKTGTLEVEVAKHGFAAAFAEVPRIAAAHGGFVASSSSTRSGDDGRQSAGSLVVRVPADRFDAAREQLAGLGELRSQQLQGDDVGGQLTDLDARLRNLRSHEEAVRVLMTKTATVGETIEVQRQLTTVREQIEQLAAEQARLADAVARSTITLTLAEPGVGVGEPRDAAALRHAWGRAVAGTEHVLAGLIVVVGHLLPLAVLAGLAWLVVRPLVARRRREAPAAAG